MTIRLAWLSDIHLDSVDQLDIDHFVTSISDANPDSILISGDIGTANSIERYLTLLEQSLQIPIYFVLGNHDFYGGSIGDVRSLVTKLCEKSQNLHWLTDESIVPLTKTTCLIGHDGWADGRFGDYAGSDLLLNDYFVIRDFQLLGAVNLLIEDKERRLRLMQALAGQAATHFAEHLPKALQRFDQAILLTHVPPFRESCWHEGRISDDNSLPHFCSKVVGDVLLESMRAQPTKKTTILCGHTHSEGVANILPNLKTLTGRATYGLPEVQSYLEIM